MKMRAETTDEWKDIGIIEEVTSLMKHRLGRGVIFRTVDGVEIFMSQKEIDSWSTPEQPSTFPRF